MADMIPGLDPSLLPGFLAEAQAQMDHINEAVASLQETPGAAAPLVSLGAAARQLKHKAAALGLQGIVVEAQRLEWWAQESPAPSAGAMATLHEARTELRRLLDGFTADLGFAS